MKEKARQRQADQIAAKKEKKLTEATSPTAAKSPMAKADASAEGPKITSASPSAFPAPKNSYEFKRHLLSLSSDAASKNLKEYLCTNVGAKKIIEMYKKTSIEADEISQIVRALYKHLDVSVEEEKERGMNFVWALSRTHL